MASFSAQLLVAGERYSVRQCTYEFTQATDPRGRVMARVRMGLVYLTLDVPTNDVLLDWAATPDKPLAGAVIFLAAQSGSALETLGWEAGQCVGYQEEFMAGDQEVGAYVCHLTIAAPKLTLQPGGPLADSSPDIVPALPGPPVALLVPPPIAPPTTPLVLPTVEELAAAAGERLLTAALEAAATAALPAVLTLGLLLLSATPAQAPGIPQPHYPPLSPDALRLANLESLRETRTLTAAEEAELIQLLAKVRGVYVSGLEDVAFQYSRDIAINDWWDQHAPTELRQLNLQETLTHVADRDPTEMRANGISGAHDKLNWAKYSHDYKEISRTSHPTTPGVEQVRYQIPAINRDGSRTGTFKNKVLDKSLYDPQVWPPPRLERALKQAISDAYRTNDNTLPREWDGLTAEGYPIHGYYNSTTNKITSFFFK